MGTRILAAEEINIYIILDIKYQPVQQLLNNLHLDNDGEIVAGCGSWSHEGCRVFFLHYFCKTQIVTWEQKLENTNGTL